MQRNWLLTGRPQNPPVQIWTCRVKYCWTCSCSCCLITKETHHSLWTEGEVTGSQVRSCFLTLQTQAQGFHVLMQWHCLSWPAVIQHSNCCKCVQRDHLAPHIFFIVEVIGLLNGNIETLMLLVFFFLLSFFYKHTERCLRFRNLDLYL